MTSTGFSFGFSKTVKRKLTTQPSAKLGTDKKFKEDDDKEFIQTIGAKGEIGGKKESAESNELVIPLIKNNRWYFPKAETNGDSSPAIANGKSTKMADKDDDLKAVTAKADDLEARAIRELLNEGREAGDKETPLHIPLLVQNRIPEGYETDEALDVTLRPAEPTLDDYERVPIEEFGLALLRGMGWKKGEGIGLRNKTVVEMKEPELRPRGLGLGATRPNSDANGTTDDEKNKSSSGSGKKGPPSPPPVGLRLNKNSLTSANNKRH